MEGVHIYFEIQLDEDRILADGPYDLDQMYTFMDEAFAAHDCCLEKTDGKKRIYTRNIDNKDLGYLMMAASIVEKTNWFEEYACHYMLYIYDEENDELDTEENWLVECDILLRRSLRTKAKEIITDMMKTYGDAPHQFFRETSGCSDTVKRLLSATSYQSIEEDGFILYHRKDFGDYQSGLRLISVSLDRCEMAGIASLICLMQKNQLPDSVMVAFLKNTDEKRQGIQKLVKLVRKAKRTFRTIVLDVTNTGWEEKCDFTVENCCLTQRMYKNLISALHGGRNKWKIIPEDRLLLKGILFSDEYFTSNAPRKNDCDYYRDGKVNCFSFCLPVEGNISNDEGITINLFRLSWYMYKLIQLAAKKI